MIKAPTFHIFFNRSVSKKRSEMILQESETNRLIRKCLTVAMNLFVFIGVVLLIAQVLISLVGQFSLADIFGVFVSCAFIAIGLYFRTRIARIDELGEDFLSLSSQFRYIRLQFKDIISIKKMVRFTLSERAWFVVSYSNENGKKERWLFQGEPEIGLIDYLENSKIKINNMS